MWRRHLDVPVSRCSRGASLACVKDDALHVAAERSAPDREGADHPGRVVGRATGADGDAEFLGGTADSAELVHSRHRASAAGSSQPTGTTAPLSAVVWPTARHQYEPAQAKSFNELVPATGR